MTINDKTPHEQFDELLDLLWAGDLDSKGEAMLEAVAGGDPDLAARLARERRITSMLAGSGPNHAPEGLAGAVFARLDESAPAQVVEVKPRRLWWTPRLQWGLAAAALIAIGIQGMWVIYREDPRDTASFANSMANREYGYQTSTEQPPASKPAAAAPAPKRQSEKSTERRIAAVTTPKATPTPRPAEAAAPKMEIAQADPQAVKPAPSPTPKPQAEAVDEMQTEEMEPAADEPKTETRQLAGPVVTPGAGAWRAKPSRFDPRPDQERAVAAAAAATPSPTNPESAPHGVVIRIALASAPAATDEGQPVRVAPEPAASTVSEKLHIGGQEPNLNNIVQGFAPRSPTGRGIAVNSFAPRQPASVSHNDVKRSLAVPVYVSHDQLEQAITAAGGTVKSSRQTRINPPAYRIDGSIPQSGMNGFIERLDQLGIRKTGDNRYTVMQGEDLLQTKSELSTATQRVTNQAAVLPITLLLDESHR